MRVNKSILFILLIIFPIFSTILITNEIPNISKFPENNSENNNLFKSADTGVSNYTINNYVEYDVEINFTLINKDSSGKKYNFKFARLNDRQPNSTLTQFCPPYQESQLLYNKTTGANQILENQHDKFNNTFDLFNATLGDTETVTYSAKYNITLNAIAFKSIDDSGIGEYDKSDDIFRLYCNNSEEYYNRTDLDLIIASDWICDDPADNIIEKAQKIYNNVSNYLTYNAQNEEKGASWAYDNREGDCSEYSSLMITLLRIQDIPARKVSGFLVSNDPNLRPQIGDIWTFREIFDQTVGPIGGFVFRASNFKRHAWVEYYVPDVGWVACDPTWGVGGYNYFNRIDYLRFNEMNGAWFLQPPNFNVSEFGNPGITYPTVSNFSSDFKIKITVTDTDVIPLVADEDDDNGKNGDKTTLMEFLLSPLGLLIIGSCVAAMIIIIILIIKAARKSDEKGREKIRALMERSNY